MFSFCDLGTPFLRYSAFYHRENPFCMLARFKQANFLDCRIGAYPSREERNVSSAKEDEGIQKLMKYSRSTQF